MGLIKPGYSFHWPEVPEGVTDVPSLRLRPLDLEAYNLLVVAHGQSKVTEKWGPVFEPWEPEKPKIEAPQSPAEFTRALTAAEPTSKAVAKKHKRLADQ
jgi:hypothetical protein